MTVTVGTDSYIGLEAADLYWSERNQVAWAGAEVLAKEAALREATQYLDGRFDWVGSHPGGGQVLGWPRLNALDHEGRALIGIPEKLEAATAELALEALGTRLLPAEARGGRTLREKVGSLEVEYQATAQGGKTYPFAVLLLKGLFASDGTVTSLVRA